MKTPLHFFAALLAVFAFVGQAHSKGYIAATTPTATGFSLKFATNGTPLATMTQTASGVAVAATASVPITPAVFFTAAATGAIGGASAGGAWGLAAGALGGVALLALPDIVSMMTRAGVRVNPANGGIQKTDSSVCTVAPCYEHRIYVQTRGFYTAWAPSISATCNNYAAALVGTSKTMLSCTTYNGGAPYNGVAYASFTGGGSDIGEKRTGGAVQSAAYVDILLTEGIDKMSVNAPTIAEVQALVDLAFPPVVAAVSITGPASVTLQNTVQMFSPSERQQIIEEAAITYTPTHIAIGTPSKKVITTKDAVTTTTTTKDTAGNVTGTATTTTPAASSTVDVSTEKKPVTACGLGGSNSPACKIDETGTPAYDPAILALDKTALDTAATAQRDVIKGTADKGMFSSWTAFFTLPTLRACEPVSMPAYAGFQIGSMDICPAAEWLRGLMGFVWAAVGFMFCFRTVQGVM